MRKSLILVSWCMIFCLLLFCKSEARESKDHLSLSFTKTISVKRTKDTMVSPSPSYSFDVKEHIVAPGECVSNILLHTYKVPRHLVFKEFIRHFCELNPDIKDPNIIKVHQRIRVPVQKRIPEEKRELADKSQTQPLPAETTDTPQEPPSPGGAEVQMASTETEKTAPTQTEPDPRAFQDSIGAFFVNIGERYNNKGNYHIPVPGGGELTLDSTAFPVLEMENGRKVIIDMGNELPARVEKLIESNWKKYRFVDVRKDESVESVFAKLFSVSGYYSATRENDPITLNGDITVEIWSDWKIIKDKESARTGRTVAVNIVNKGDKGTPPAIKNYLQRSGVKVVDFSLAGKKKERNDQEEGVTGAGEGVDILDSSNNKQLVSTLLTLINQPFTENAKLSLSKTSGAAFQMGITADIYLSKGGNDFIITLKDLPDDMVDMLTENAFRVLETRKDEPSKSVISKVLTFLGMEYSSSTFDFDTVQKGDPHNITVSIPGFMLQENPSYKTLFTEANLDRDLNRFLRDKGVRAVRY